MIAPRARASKLLDDIINQIAKEEEVSIKKVDIILQSVFGLIANDFRTESCKTTSILYLGRFLVKPYKLRKFLDKKNESNIENKG